MILGMLRGKFRLDVPALLRASDRLLFLHHRRLPPLAAATIPLGPDPMALARAEAATGWPLPALYVHPPELLLPPATVSPAGPYRARGPAALPAAVQDGEVGEMFPGLDAAFHEALDRDPREKRNRRRREERRQAKEAAGAKAGACGDDGLVEGGGVEEGTGGTGKGKGKRRRV